MDQADDREWLGGEHPSNPSLVRDNIEKLLEHERIASERRTPSQRFADLIAQIAGSLGFVVFNALFFIFWILANTGKLGIKIFDPYPYGMLTMIVSLEAIFLSIFVLVAQNRMQYMSDRRSELDVQVNLLTEYEVTRILRLVGRIAEKLKIDESEDPEIVELQEDVDPAQLIEEIEQQRNGGD